MFLKNSKLLWKHSFFNTFFLLLQIVNIKSKLYINKAYIKRIRRCHRIQKRTEKKHREQKD